MNAWELDPAIREEMKKEVDDCLPQKIKLYKASQNQDKFVIHELAPNLKLEEKHPHEDEYITLEIFRNMSSVFPDLFAGRQVVPALFTERSRTVGPLSANEKVWVTWPQYVSWPAENVDIHAVCRAMAERLRQLASPHNFRPHLRIWCTAGNPETVKHEPAAELVRGELVAEIERDGEVTVWFWRPNVEYQNRELIEILSRPEESVK